MLEPIVAADPEDQELAYALAETYTALGTIAAAHAAHSQAAARLDSESPCGWFQKSLAVWSRIPNPARMSTSGFEVTMPSEVAKRLQRCQAAVAAPAATASR